MQSRQKTILSFDLDYTLINNRKGIAKSFNYFLRKFDLPKIDKSVIEKMIGLPLNNMFAKYTELNPSILAYTFREYYRIKGIYQSKLLPGVKNKLKELRDHGFQLGIITSEKQEMAIKILEFLKIDMVFNYVLGESNQIKSKLDPNLKLILHEKNPRSGFIIIGDHPKDALLSKNLSCPFIGLLTGSHDEESLRKARENDEITIILKNIKQITIEMINKLINDFR